MRRHRKYLNAVALASIVAVAFIMVIKVFQKNKQDKKPMLDVGASPSSTALSKLDQSLKGKGLPDIVELDYEPIEIKKGMTAIDWQDAIINLALQRQVVCQDWQMYGGMRGSWPVCKAAALIPQKPCTVYSFGIKYDWSFDDAYRKAHGCIIRTFDPSMGATPRHEHKPGVFFYPIGLSDKKEIQVRKGVKWQMDSYGNLLERFDEESDIIPYLKFDIEAMEWRVLESMLADGSLENVMQLSFEIHVDVFPNIPTYFKILKKLEAIGFRRWFYHHRLNGFPFQCDQAFINMKYVNRPL